MEPLTIAILTYSSGVLITTISTYYVSTHMSNIIFDIIETKCKNIGELNFFL
jgi:hypothetical protein